MLDDVKRFADVFLRKSQVRSGNDDGPVIAFGVNDGHTHSGTCVRVDSHVLRIDLSTQQITQQAFTKIVIAHATDHESLGTKLSGGNGLVSSLAACLVHPGTAGQRLALSRPVWGMHHDVKVQASEHCNSR